MPNPRREKRGNRILAALALSAGSIAGCAHGVRIISVPSDARVWIDGELLGKAPLVYRERSGSPGRSFKIRAELPGRPPIERTETVRICPTPANLLLDSLLVGFPFGFCLRDEYVLDFTSG